MAMGVYLGAGSVKELKSCYVGAGGVKTVNAIYVGAGGVKQVWPSWSDGDVIFSTSDTWTLLKKDYSYSSWSSYGTGNEIVLNRFSASYGGCFISESNVDASIYNYLRVYFAIRCSVSQLNNSYVYCSINSSTSTPAENDSGCGYFDYSGLYVGGSYFNYYYVLVDIRSCTRNARFKFEFRPGGVSGAGSSDQTHLGMSTVQVYSDKPSTTVLGTCTLT